MISPILFLLQVALVISSQQAIQPQLSPSPSTQPTPSTPIGVQPLGASVVETTTALQSLEANTTSNATAANSTESEVPTCFFEPPTACVNVTGRRRCHPVPSSPGSVRCCNLDSQRAIREGLRHANIPLKDIERLHLRNVTVKVLDVGTDIWNELVSLQQLAITDGTVQILQGRLKSPHLNCLNLSANALTQLPILNVAVDHLWIDLVENNGLSCTSIRNFKSHFKNSSSADRITTKLQFAHDNQTYCLTSQNYNWFNTTERVSLAQVETLTSLDEDCPSFSACSCRCEIALTDMRIGADPILSVKVNCSRCGLTELPPRLPPHTIMLDVSNNRIWNLTALSLNSYYSEIRHFLADNNSIASIDILEGSPFIQNFVQLSLRGNNISRLPIYILSSGFDRSWEQRRVNLGQNRLKCDCSTAQTIKVWLINHKKHIQDYLEVMCANMPERVVKLDQNKICAVQSDWTDYIYYIIAGEVALLILLIAKVSYDYWVFKTAGYLPWPASKMPKLPCDWVFE